MRFAENIAEESQRKIDRIAQGYRNYCFLKDKESYPKKIWEPKLWKLGELFLKYYFYDEDQWAKSYNYSKR